MGLGDILDGAFKLLRANARSVVLVTAAFAVPLNLVTSYLTRGVLGGLTLGDAVDDPTAAQTALETSSAEQAVGSVISVITTAVILPLVAGAICRIVAASYLGRSERPGEALRVLRRRGVALVVGWLVVHVVELGPALVIGAAVVLLAVLTDGGVAAALVVVGGFLVALGWVVFATPRMVAVSPAIVEEGLGPFAGVGRSWRLTRGRFWGYLGVVVVSGLLASVLDSVLNGPAQILGAVVGLEQGGWVITAVGAMLAQMVTTPFIAIVATLAYFDARIRREGLDLEVMAEELERGRPR